MVRTVLADLLGMAESDLRVVVPDVGGAFGQKFCLAPEDVVTAWVARRLRTTVSWVEDRRENLMSSFHSRDHHYRVRGAFDADARLLAVDADLLCNIGAYSCYPVTCGVEPLMALAEFPGPYDFRTYRVRSRGVTTNTCPMAPYRGVSRPVITLAMERLMDLAAVRFGIEPAEIRRHNLVAEFPYTSATGLVYDEGSYVESLDRAVEAIGLEDFRGRQAAAHSEGRYLGVGFSVFSERTGYGTSAFAARSMDVTPGYETVDLTMDPSGNVEARLGASPHGQGLETTLAQLIGDELGVEPARVRIVHGDTDRTPYGWGTFASRSLVIAGGAARLASGRLRAKLAAIASAELEAAPEDIVIGAGRATVAGTDAGIGVADLARLAYHSSHRLAAGMDPGLTATATYDPAGTFSNACHVATVEVDPETGGVRVDRFVVVEDAGRLINPMIVDGQLHGGVTQGDRRRPVRGDPVRRGGQHPHDLAHGLPAAHPGGGSHLRDPPPRDHLRRHHYRRQGLGGGGNDRRAGRHHQRGRRCAPASRGRDHGDARHPVPGCVGWYARGRGFPHERANQGRSHPRGQRPVLPGPGGAPAHPGRHAARRLRPYRNPLGVRARRVRGLHDPGRRPAGPVLPDVRRPV